MKKESTANKHSLLQDNNKVTVGHAMCQNLRKVVQKYNRLDKLGGKKRESVFDRLDLIKWSLLGSNIYGGAVHCIYSEL